MIVSKNTIDNYFEVYILLIYTVFNTKETITTFLEIIFHWR